jgi:hypothetical protein
MMGQVTEADRQALLPLAQELFKEAPESLLPQVGEDWRKLQGQQRLTETNRTNKVKEGIATDREARLGSGGGSGGSGKGDGQPKGTKTDKQYRKEYEDLGRDIKGINAKIKLTTDASDLKKLAGDLADKTAKLKDIENYIEWTDEELKAMGVAVTDMMGSFGLSPTNPNPNPPGFTGALGGKQPQKTNTGGKGGGGNKNPQPQAKPVKSAPDAKKGQQQPGVVVTKSKTKFFDKKPTK